LTARRLQVRALKIHASMLPIQHLRLPNCPWTFALHGPPDASEREQNKKTAAEPRSLSTPVFKTEWLFVRHQQHNAHR
jgi:hypothetical protein